VPEATVDVAIAGGGPFGLMLTNELGRRGVRVALFDAKPSTAVNPQANATQARAMEHYRRLGFADEVRSLGLPADFPTDIAYFTRLTTHELARFRLPFAREARARVSQHPVGIVERAELPHRVSQKYVERVLRRHAEALPGVSIHYGWRLTGFAESADGVGATVERVDGEGSRRIAATSSAPTGHGARSAGGSRSAGPARRASSATSSAAARTRSTCARRRSTTWSRTRRRG
jgi:2-polyprenyl-6-methoxyphenol hydroxylase-like FAD-dependent oxidoreductase